MHLPRFVDQLIELGQNVLLNPLGGQSGIKQLAKPRGAGGHLVQRDQESVGDLLLVEPPLELPFAFGTGGFVRLDLGLVRLQAQQVIQ